MSKNKLPEPSKFFSKEAEAAVLGSMLIDPPCIPKVLPWLPRADSFYLPENQLIYEALIKLFFNQVPVDAISLRTELKQQGAFSEFGGELETTEYISQLLDSVPSSANVIYYAGVIRDMEKERQAYSAVGMMSQVVDGPGSPDEKIQRIRSIALELETSKSGADFVEMRKVVAQIANDMRDVVWADAIKTGYKDLDGLIQGLHPGDLGIIASRPSMGKTTLALSISLNMAEAGIPVFISTLEMTETRLIERALCASASVDMTLISSGQANEDDWAEVNYQVEELQKRDIILSKTARTPEQLAGLVHRFRQTHNIGCVFVDYIQLMRTSRKNESRQQEITEISAKLKEIAMRENIPVVALSQLNRQVDSRENHRPRMSDLRESGSLEQDADLIMMLYREDYYRKQEEGSDFAPDGVSEIIVAKNRSGRTGVIRLVFVDNYVKFSDLLHGAQYYE